MDFVMPLPSTIGATLFGKARDDEEAQNPKSVALDDFADEAGGGAQGVSLSHTREPSPSVDSPTGEGEGDSLLRLRHLAL